MRQSAARDGPASSARSLRPRRRQVDYSRELVHEGQLPWEQKQEVLAVLTTAGSCCWPASTHCDHAALLLQARKRASEAQQQLSNSTSTSVAPLRLRVAKLQKLQAAAVPDDSSREYVCVCGSAVGADAY